MKSYVQTISIFALFLLFKLCDNVYAQGIGVYAPLLGNGDAITIATASSGITDYRGLSGGNGNPALYNTGRNELLLEAEFWDGIPLQSGVRSPGARFGAGETGYLVSTQNSSFMLAYIPRKHIHASAGPYGNSEKKDRLTSNRLETAYARQFGDDFQTGIAVRWIRGEYATGNLVDGAYDLETIYRPSLIEIAIGINKQYNSFSLGAVLESPATGVYEKGIDSNIGGARYKTKHNFEGAPSIRLGAGRNGELVNFDSDVLFRPVESVTGDNTVFDAEGYIFEYGISTSQSFFQDLNMYSGARLRIGDLSAGNSLIAGIGAAYFVNNDLTINGGMGILIPVSHGYEGATLEDMLPFTLRIGVLYHGE
ncbi:hypothetical protein ACFLQJ_02600 [Calditrichota bacterium]